MMNQPAQHPSIQHSATDQPDRQMDLSPEVLDQWESELDQFASDISQRLAIVSSLVPRPQTRQTTAS